VSSPMDISLFSWFWAPMCLFEFLGLLFELRACHKICACFEVRSWGPWGSRMKVARGFRAFCFRGFGGMALNLSLKSIALSFRPGVCVTVILEI
jgi:hypothetical protein